MPWGDNLRYQARDHEARANQFVEEAERLESEAANLERKLAAERKADRIRPDQRPTWQTNTLNSSPSHLVSASPTTQPRPRNPVTAPIKPASILDAERELRQITEQLKSCSPSRKRDLEQKRILLYLRIADAETSATEQAERSASDIGIPRVLSGEQPAYIAEQLAALNRLQVSDAMPEPPMLPSGQPVKPKRIVRWHKALFA